MCVHTIAKDTRGAYTRFQTGRSPPTRHATSEGSQFMFKFPNWNPIICATYYSVFVFFTSFKNLSTFATQQSCLFYRSQKPIIRNIFVDFYQFQKPIAHNIFVYFTIVSKVYQVSFSTQHMSKRYTASNGKPRTYAKDNKTHKKDGVSNSTLHLPWWFSQSNQDDAKSGLTASSKCVVKTTEAFPETGTLGL